MLKMINTNAHQFLLAKVDNTGTQTFLDTQVGKLFQAGLGAFGFLIVVYAIYTVGKSVSKSGFKPENLKTIVGAAILATICFTPDLVGTIIDGFSGVVEPIAKSIKDFITNSK
jgi:hypothetical protein